MKISNELIINNSLVAGASCIGTLLKHSIYIYIYTYIHAHI